MQNNTPRTPTRTPRTAASDNKGYTCKSSKRRHTTTYDKKKHLKEIGGWNQDQGYLADGYTYEELAKKYDYIEVPEVLGIHF